MTGIFQGIVITLIIFGAKCANATECPQPVQVIQKGETANCSGFLFSDDAEKRAAEARDDVIYYKKLVPKLEEKTRKEVKRNEILEKRLDLYMKQSQELAEKRAENENTKFLKRLGYFILGGLTMYGAYEVAR